LEGGLEGEGADASGARRDDAASSAAAAIARRAAMSPRVATRRLQFGTDEKTRKKPGKNAV
jgi:hypothetical protein